MVSKLAFMLNLLSLMLIIGAGVFGFLGVKNLAPMYARSWLFRAGLVLLVLGVIYIMGRNVRWW